MIKLTHETARDMVRNGTMSVVEALNSVDLPWTPKPEPYSYREPMAWSFPALFNYWGEVGHARHREGVDAATVLAYHGKDELQPETTRPHPFRNSRDKAKLNAFRVLRALKTSYSEVSSVQLAQRSGLKLSAVKTCCRLLRKLGVIQLVSGKLWEARTYTTWHRRQESDGTCKLWKPRSMGRAIERASDKLTVKRAGLADVIYHEVTRIGAYSYRQAKRTKGARTHGLGVNVQALRESRGLQRAHYPMVSAGAESPSEGQKLVREACSGNGPLACLDNDSLTRLVAQSAPFDKAARDQFYSSLRAYADRVHPTY